ncbi:MAG TPA: GNAT family N-acetyltransferase [Opitutaceae bacterium]|nr:GNAT family N-acetyltransferase [Opitutaceae bacterium]
MTVADLPAARELWAAAEGVELAEGDSVSELSAYLDRNPHLSQIAELDGRVVGAVLAGHDGRRGFLYHLAVDHERRGSGLGTALVDRALAALKAAGVVRVLILVARDNPSGRRFWSNRGWEGLAFAEVMGRDL